jgi:hypothetical protein
MQIDLAPSEYHRVTKGEKRRWSGIDLVIVGLLLLLFAMLASTGDWMLVLGGMLGTGLWIAGMCCLCDGPRRLRLGGGSQYCD